MPGGGRQHAPGLVEGRDINFAYYYGFGTLVPSFSHDSLSERIEVLLVGYIP
jgi:hypothetical protein